MSQPISVLSGAAGIALSVIKKQSCIILFASYVYTLTDLNLCLLSSHLGCSVGLGYGWIIQVRIGGQRNPCFVVLAASSKCSEKTAALTVDFIKLSGSTLGNDMALKIITDCKT